MRYVKICTCGHENDEDAAKCRECGQLLGMIPVTDIEEPSSSDQQIQEQDSSAFAEGGTAPEGIPEAPPPHYVEVPRTQGLGQDFLVLQFVRGNRVFNLRNGQILGRDDGSPDTDRVNIPADAGVDVGYVSRWHCRFHRRDGHWYVTPLNSFHFGGELETPNPTFLGAELLSVEQEFEVHNGDRLTLADVELRVVIPGGAP